MTLIWMFGKFLVETVQIGDQIVTADGVAGADAQLSAV